MATSYPDRTNARGIWTLDDITKNKLTHKTFPRGATRGIMGGGGTPSASDVIDFINIETAGDASDFGNLTAASYRSTACASVTRGVFMAGYIAPAYIDVLEYITILSTGNTADFGDSTQARGTGNEGNLGNNTRGINAGGIGGSPAARVNTIDYITIA